MSLLYHLVFVIITIFILLKIIFYGLYEINTQNNKSGGIAIIFFSILVIVFTNIIVFLR